MFMVLKIIKLGPGVPDELYIDFAYKEAGWRGPYPMSTSAYDLMIGRMKKFKRWNEYGIDYGDSTESSSEDEESTSPESSSDDEEDSEDGKEDLIMAGGEVPCSAPRLAHM